MAWVYFDKTKRQTERWKRHLSDRDVPELWIGLDAVSNEWDVIYMDRYIGCVPVGNDVTQTHREAESILRRFLEAELAALAGN